MPIDFKTEIEAMRHNFIQGNKRIGRLPKPAWMTASDTLNRIYNELPELVETGKIHFAFLVQANLILFESYPPLDCPADIVFSTNGYYDENPYELGELAIKLYSYKGIDGAPENIKNITDSITDEYERLYNIKLPDSMDIKSNVFFTSLMIYRKHLPGRKLSGSIFPIITSPENLQSSMILPKKYWTSVFVDFFNRKYCD